MSGGAKRQCDREPAPTSVHDLQQERGEHRGEEQQHRDDDDDPVARDERPEERVERRHGLLGAE